MLDRNCKQKFLHLHVYFWVCISLAHPLFLLIFYYFFRYSIWSFACLRCTELCFLARKGQHLKIGPAVIWTLSTWFLKALAYIYLQHFDIHYETTWLWPFSCNLEPNCACFLVLFPNWQTRMGAEDSTKWINSHKALTRNEN